MLGVRPSFATGFVQWPGMSEYPQLWTGLVGAWDASLGPTGSVLKDWSGNRNDGAFVNATAWTKGKFGPATSHPGTTNDYIIANSYFGDIDFKTQPITVSTWVYLNALTVWHIYLGIKPTTTTNIGLQILVRNDNKPAITFVREDNDNTGRVGITGANTLSAGIWYHIVWTYDGNGTPDTTTVCLYINGVKQSVAAVVAETLWLAGDSQITFGSVGAAAGERLQGLLDLPIIYNRALSASEVALLHYLRKRLVA